MQDSQDQSAPQADADRRELARAAKARSPKEAAALLA